MAELEKVEQRAETLEEANAKGFWGVTNSYPNELHEAGSEQLRADVFGTNTEVPTAVGRPNRATLKGAVVNSDDAPKPSGGTSGPGANQPSTADDTPK